MPIDQTFIDRVNARLNGSSSVTGPDAIPPANPDNLGRSLKLVRTNGGYPLVEAEDPQALDMAERQAAWDRLVGEAPKTVEHFAQNPIAAALAQNDWEPVGAVEKSIFVLGEGARIPYQAGAGISSSMYGLLAAGSESMNLLASSAKRTAADIFSRLFLPAARQGQGRPTLESLAGPLSPESDVSKYLRATASGVSQLAQDYGTGAGNYGGDIGRMIAGGAASAYQNAMMLGFAGTIAPMAAGTRMAVAAPLIPMGLTTAGGEYQKARDAGLPVGQAISYAGTQGGIEMATGALPFGILVDDIKASMPIAKIIGKQLLAENVEEQVATHAQDFNEWINLHPEKTIGDYLKERPNAALQTFVQTTVATLLLAGPGSIAMRSSYLDMQRADAAMAQRRTDALAAMHKAAAASKTLQRDRHTFEEIVAAQSKDGPVTDVYIDAQVLNQSGLADQVVADSPSAAEQYQAALETGAQIRIPVSEYAARIAPQAYAQQLVEDVRFDPLEMSLREAKDYQQSGAMQDLEKAMSSIIVDKAQSDAFTASREAVKQQVLDNLNALGRFSPQKNELDATLIAARSATMAAKLGITPEQFFQDHLLKVVSEGAGGQALNQFAGQGALTADLGALKVAQDRVANGEDPEAVRRETGWHTGTDGKWRFEISDADAKLTPAIKSLDRGGFDAANIQEITYRKNDDGSYSVAMMHSGAKDSSGFVNLDSVPEEVVRAILPDDVFASVQRGDGEADFIGANLEDAKTIKTPFRFDGMNALPLDMVIDHPALFAAYPALRQVMVKVDPKAGIGGSLAEMGDGTFVITVGSGQKQSTMLHEIQHAIQQYEGFASGGNPKNMGVRVTEARWKVEDLSRRLQQIENAAGDEADLWMAKYPDKVREALDYLRERGLFDEGDDVRDAVKYAIYERDPSYQSLTKEWRQAKETAQQSPTEAYRRLAGEVEARNTQARANMTDAERRATSPQSTADVAERDQIVQYAEGLAQMVSDKPTDADIAIGSPEWASYWYEERDVPEGWYVHGRAGRKDLNTGSVIQLTKDWDIADQYAGKSGSKWLIRPKDSAKIFDMTDHDVLKMVVDRFMSDYEDGNLPSSLDDFVNSDYSDEENRDRISSSFNPDDIVSSAEAYDVPAAASWIYGTFGAEFIITNDGAVVIDIDSVESVMVPDGDYYYQSSTVSTGALSPASGNILEQTKRGWFSPATNTMALLKNADLSTFLHESGHYFLETEVSVARSILQENAAFGADTMPAGKQSILRDLSALFKWFGIEGDIASQIDQWDRMDFEEKRSYHERMAESFERYMLEGRAPSIELQSAFQSFRQWLISVYKSLKDFLKRHPDAGALNDEVRGVFDRMIATDEEIALAQQARSLIPLFADAVEAGMTPEAFAEYQKLGEDATRAAIDEMQAKGLRDMKWLGNARSRMLKNLQKQAKVQRAEVRSQIRAEVIDEPIYRAWLFLTSKMGDEDKLAATKRGRSASVDPAVDSLFEAIAKLGGIDREQIATQWGYDKADKADSGLFGKPVVRAKNGRSIDALVEVLTEEGYLTPDENGKGDAAELEERFKEELRGNRQYSVIKDWQDAPVPGQGEDFTGVSAGRIDLASLEAMDLPQEVIDRLKDLKMTAKDGGIHPDVLSEILPGEWSSGDELMRALAKARSLNDEVEARTDRVMLETYAELATPEAIEQAADMAVHNDLRGRMLAAEYNILNKAAGDTKLIVTAAREYARNLLSRQKVRDIRPSLYTAAESRAAKALAKATDLAQKAVEKRNQILSFYSAKEAYAIKEEIAKGLRYFKRLSDAKRLRQRLPVEYAEQIEAMLSRYQLKPESANQADKRASYGAWVRAQLERGVVPYVNELLLSPQSRAAFEAQVYERDEAGNMAVRADMGPIEQAQLMAQLLDQDARRSYQDMTVEEFRGLIDTLKNIEHLGRTKDKMLTSQNGKAYEVQRDELVDSVRENSAHLPDADNRTVPTAADRRAKNIRTFGASIRKVAMLMRLMDGNKDGGPMWSFFIRSANERGDMETEMIAKATVELRRLFDPILKKKPMMEGKGKYFESIGRSLIWEQRIGLALNVGNDGNLQRLLDGEGWTFDDIRPVLESITAEEWQAIQGVWDHMDSYRPQIAALERRTGGVEPQWVQPRQFTVTTKDGQQLTLKGGYYPVKYDTRASRRARQMADATDAKAAMRGAFNSTTTHQSFIKSRAEKVVGRPLELSMSAMYGGIEDVIHDLAWREWLIDANRMMNSTALDGAIRQKYGFETVDAIDGWIMDIASGNRRAREAGSEVANFMRRQLAAAGMAFNIMNGIQNVTGLANSIQRVGAKWIAIGQREFILHPITASEWINEKSSFMKHRAMTQFRELNELRNRVEKGSLWSSYQEKEFTIMTLTQRLVDGPTWIGAYRKAEADGFVTVRDDGSVDDAQAVAMADQAVIDAQGSGMVKDQTALERGGSFAKLFTIYYAYMGTVYNLQANEVGGARGGTPTQRGHVALRVLLAMTLPSALMVIIKSLLTPGDDDLLDDPEKLIKEVGLSTASYIFGMVPFLRELFPTFRAAVGAESFGYEGPAGVRVIGDTYKFAQQARQGEMDDSFRKSAVNLSGSLFGLPSTQINRTWTGAEALANDKTDNWSALMFGYQEKK